MYYTDSFITELDSQVQIEKGDAYVETVSKLAAKMLDENRLTYKMYGVYWWAVKDGLRKYVSNGEWYCKSHDDPLMKERAWHGSLYRTVLAGTYYMNQAVSCDENHLWYDKNENERDYNLFDIDAGC